MIWNMLNTYTVIQYGVSVSGLKLKLGCQILTQTFDRFLEGIACVISIRHWVSCILALVHTQALDLRQWYVG